MLPKKNRLKRADFSVRRKWMTYSNSLVTIRIAPSSAPTQVSVVVPKAVIKSSVDRHHLKRLLYSNIEKHNFQGKKNVCMILRLTSYPDSVSEKELKTKTDELLTYIENMLR